MEAKKKQASKTRKEKVHRIKKEGLDLEKEVAKKYNKFVQSKKKQLNKPSFSNNTARQQIGSGSLWFAPSDVVTEEELIECKERGTTTSKGEKTISIQKKWLDKVKKESFLANKKSWYLTFRYKESPITLM
jgi:hypothetical protein